MSLVKLCYDMCVCIIAQTPEERSGDNGLVGNAILGIVLAFIASLILIIIAIIIGVCKNRRSSDATDG